MAFGADIRRGDSRELLQHFAAVGADLYQGDAHPAVPSVARTLALLGADDPTRRRCELQLLLVDGPGGRGRVAAIVNPRLVDDDDRPIGLYGFFECDDNQDNARRLLDEAAEWLHKRNCALVRGPVDFTTWHNCRFVVESTTSEWIPGEPYHHEYYPAHFGAAEMTEAAVYRTSWLGDPEHRIDRFADRAGRCCDAGYTVRHIDPDTDLDALFAVSIDALSSAWMYSPIERDEFAALCTREQAAIAAPYSYIALGPSGDPVGFVYAFPMALAGRARVMVGKTIAVVPAGQDELVRDVLIHTWLSEQVGAGVRDIMVALVHREGSSDLVDWTRPETRIKEYKIYERKL